MKIEYILYARISGICSGSSLNIAYVFRDFIYPIILSIIAGIIFWLIFSYLPERRRTNKIRPKLDSELYIVYSELFSIFDLVMRFPGSPGLYQNKIRANTFKKSDIESGLQNKCLNQTYLYYPEINDVLEVIGPSLYERTNKIQIAIDRLFNFSNYLSADEILLVQEIRKNLERYNINSYNTPAFYTINGQQYAPADPSLSYRSNNIYELYTLFVQLQTVIFKSEYTNKEKTIAKTQYLFYTGRYKKGQKWITKTVGKYPDARNLLSLYQCLSLYRSGKNSKALNLFQDIIIKNKPELVPNRNIISEFQVDESIKAEIEENYTQNEIDEMKSVLADEGRLLENFINQADRLKQYYKQKGNGLIKI